MGMLAPSAPSKRQEILIKVLSKTKARFTFGLTQRGQGLARRGQREKVRSTFVFPFLRHFLAICYRSVPWDQGQGAGAHPPPG